MKPRLRGKSSGAPQTEGPFVRLSEVADFGDNPGALKMKGYAPAGLPTGAALVVALHGCGQSPDDHERGAGWATLARRHGFALVCPQQRVRNNPNRCFNWFSPQSRSAAEAASIRQMIAHATVVYSLDPARVFIVGLSAGGCLTGQLMAAYPRAFAGGAVIAGLPFGAARNVMEAMSSMNRAPVRGAGEWGDEVRAASDGAGPWPRVSILHGSADETVAPGAAEELAKQWTDVHGLEMADGETETLPTCVRTTWKDRGGEVQVERLIFPGMSHGAPVDAAHGLGRPEPFFLDVGFSAVAHLAKTWGLTEQVLDGFTPPPTEPAKPIADLLHKASKILGLG